MVDRLDSLNSDASMLRLDAGSVEDDPYQIWHSDSYQG